MQVAGIDLKLLLEIGLILFVAGGAIAVIRTNMRSISKEIHEQNTKLDKFVDRHERHAQQLADHDKKIAVHEEKLQGLNTTLTEMRKKIESIYNLLMDKK